MEPFGRHVHQDLANLTGQEVPGLRISRLASRYAAAVAERRAREEANRHEFNLNLPHLEAVKNALAEQLEAEGAQINGHLPVASVFDAVQAVKACRGWDKDAGLRALMGHLESMWKRDRSASITASTYLKLHEHYSRNFPKSAAADVLVQIGRAGYATLPISDLQVIASQINTQEDYDRLIQRHGLNGVLPHQVKARRYILALVNEENWEEEEPAEDEGFSTEEPWQGVQQEKERHRRRREDPRRRERGYIFPGQENPNLEGKEDSKGYPILSIDAWADGEDGWTWNNWDKVGVLEDAALLDNEDALIDWFITEGFLKDTAKGKVYVDDDQYNLVITDEETHEPLFAVEYGSHEDEDLPGEPKPGTDEAPPSPERHGGSRRGSEVSEAYENDGGDARGGRDCDHEGAVVDGVCGICHERVSTPTSKQRGGSRRTRPFDGRVAGVWDQTLPSGEMKPQELADLFAEILESEGKLHLENWERVEAARPTPGWDYTVILKGVVQDVREDYGDLGVPRFAVFVQLQGAQDGGGEASGYVQMDRYGTVATSRRNTMEEAIKELAWGTTAAFRSKSEEPQQELDLHEAHRTAALLDDFADGYVTAALWSSNDESDERGGEPLDRNYSVEDIAPGSLAQMVEDCAKFQQENAEDLAQYADLREGRGGEWSSDELAGHDFWLSRNGHGTGFWDRGAGDVGDRLADAARKAGEQDLYVGDDGVIYLAGAETREARKQAGGYRAEDFTWRDQPSGAQGGSTRLYNKYGDVWAEVRWYDDDESHEKFIVSAIIPGAHGRGQEIGRYGSLEEAQQAAFDEIGIE